jgi:beta-galactosidase
MEQQPGPVNWAPHNPVPRDGMVRLWTHEAFAHGAEVVSYFRWRQVPFAQEQMHAGLLRPDSQPAQAYHEAAMVAEEMAALDLPHPERADVAIVFDYPSAWAWAIQPQGREFDYFRLVQDLYRTLRGLGLSVDLLDAKNADLAGYRLALVPGLFAWTPVLRDSLAGFDGIALIGPRTGSKTADFAIPAALPPELPAPLDGLKVARVETMRPDVSVPMADGEGSLLVWREFLDGVPERSVGLRTLDGEVATVRQDKLVYLAGWPDQALAVRLLRSVAKEAGLPVLDLPPGLRIRRSGNLTHCFNYGDETVHLPAQGIVGSPILGSLDLGPSGVAILQTG